MGRIKKPATHRWFCFYTAEQIPLTRYNLVWNIGFTNHRTPFVDLVIEVGFKAAGTDFVH